MHWISATAFPCVVSYFAFDDWCRHFYNNRHSRGNGPVQLGKNRRFSYLQKLLLPGCYSELLSAKFTFLFFSYIEHIRFLTSTESNRNVADVNLYHPFPLNFPLSLHFCCQYVTVTRLLGLLKHLIVVTLAVIWLLSL